MPPNSKQETMTSIWLHGLTLGMAAVAGYSYLLLEAEEDAGSITFIMWVLVELGLMFVAALYCRKTARTMGEMPVIIPLLVAVMLGSYVYEFFERVIFGTGHPFEYLVTCSLKNVLLSSAACGCWIKYQRLTVSGGLFIILFCLTISPQSGIVLLSLTYIVMGVIWLIFSYWHNISQHFQRSQKHQSPRWLWATLGLLLLVLVSTVSFRSQEVVHAISGFMPSSGGSGAHDHHARGGVGDGDALVAGKEDIKSFAPLEDAPFKSSEEPSLYDVFDDTYEEQVCPVHKKNERAIALPPEFSKQVAEQIAKSKQLNKTFSTLRQKSTKRKTGMQDLESHAIMFVAGRTPLHLRMETYELFDGQDWFPQSYESNEDHGYKIKDVRGRPWLEVKPSANSFGESFTLPETHALKVINLNSNRVPAPLHLRGVHIDKLTNPTFYVLAREDIIALNREQIPEMQPIHLSSVVFEPHKLQELTVGRGKYNDINLVLPNLDEMQLIKDLAQDWTKGLKPGWPAINEIVRKLRTEYTHDPKQLVSDEGKIKRGEIPCAEFLFDTRRGPDYQFATATVLMLRSMGYACRLASGFYASPERYNIKSKHTEVLIKDAHVWVELYLGAGIWATIEPTPGYEVLGPPPTTLEQLATLFLRITHEVYHYSSSLIMILIAVTGIYYFRHQLWDIGLSLKYRCLPPVTTNSIILDVNRIIIYRFEAYGLGPQPGETQQRWTRRIRQLDDLSAVELQQFAQLCNWAAFAPPDEMHPPGVTDEKLKQITTHLLKTCTLSHIRQSKLQQRQRTRDGIKPTPYTI